MELRIFHTATIGELKKQFSRYFPCLKLEYFMRPHEKSQASSLQYKYSDDTKLVAIGTMKQEGIFTFRATMSVAAFEQHLQQVYGLPVQVFRKAGDLWIETAQTDNLTLQKQNSMGEASSRPMRVNFYSFFL